MKRVSLLLALLALLIALVSPVMADEYEARTFTAPDGGKLGYRLLKPKDYDASKKYPLVLFLHGAGERGDDNSAQLRHGTKLYLKEENREKFPCFVMAPQCPKDQRWSAIRGWSDKVDYAEEPTAPMALVLATLEGLLKEFSIDQDRLYVTGLSMGGFGTWDLLVRFPNRWAAAAPICGGGDKSRIAAAAKVPIWVFHGSKDPTVKPIRSQEMVEALKAAGGKPHYTEYPGVGHDSWTPAYNEPNFLPWLFAQKRGEPEQKPELAASIAEDFKMPPVESFPGEGPVRNADWFQRLWAQRRMEFHRKKEQEQGAIVFLGDSITQGWGSLKADFPGKTIANRGISGDTTRGVRGRLKGDVIDLKPKSVSLLIGTNDLADGATPELIATNIEAIVGELRAAFPEMPMILCKVMPRGPENDFPARIKKLNELIEGIAKKDGKIKLCDTYSIFDRGNGTCRREEFPDMLHPNGNGYAKWKAALEPLLAELK